MGTMARHAKQATRFPKRVFFTASTALQQGMGVCYDRDRGTAANIDETRDTYVELPSTSNNLRFAGVAAQSYSARTGGQWITIYEPGSVCQVAVGGENSTITVDSTIRTCSASSADAGRFTFSGLPGRGTALCLQTLATGSTGVQVVAGEDDGTGALDSAGTTLTGTGFGTGTSIVKPLDRVFIYAGENDGTNAITAGEYVVSSVTNNTTLVLTAAASDGGTMQCSYYVIRNNPTCLAYLFDGQESGLQEWISPVDNTAAQSMVGGTSYINGGITMGTGTSTSTLADGIAESQRKAFCGMGTLTTNGYLVTVTSGQIGQFTPTTGEPSDALASLTFSAAGHYAVLEWHGGFGGNTAGVWVAIAGVGATAA